MNGYCRPTPAFTPFLIESQRAVSIAAATNSLSPLTQLGLGQMSQFGPNFSSFGSQLNPNDVYNLLTGFQFHSNPLAHLMNRTSQNQTGQQTSPAALTSSLTSNSALALAQYQQQLQQPQQPTHPR